jgi:hypothetical protein
MATATDQENWTGRTVRFSKPVSFEESRAMMIVVEDNGDRVIVTDCSQRGWPVQPTYLMLKSELA